jgi:hypothetical protein
MDQNGNLLSAGMSTLLPRARAADAKCRGGVKPHFRPIWELRDPAELSCLSFAAVQGILPPPQTTPNPSLPYPRLLAPSSRDPSYSLRAPSSEPPSHKPTVSGMRQFGFMQLLQSDPRFRCRQRMRDTPCASFWLTSPSQQPSALEAVSGIISRQWFHSRRHRLNKGPALDFFSPPQQ